MEHNAARRIKIRHLSAFVETVRLGSLKAAADKIGLTQPAISKTLKDLEDILGQRLLERDRGGVEMTREGAVFQQFAEQSLAALTHGLTSLEALEAGQGAALAIGALPSVAAHLLPDVVMRFADLAPGTPVQVDEGPIGALVDRLRAGGLDLVIGRLGRPGMMEGLSFTQLYSEQVVFAVAAGHPLAGADTLDKIAAGLVLYPSKRSAIRPLADRFLIAGGFGEFPNRIETVSSTFGRAMVLGPARAIWAISQGVVARDIAAGRMVTLPLDTALMAGPVGIMTRAEEDPTPPMRLFRQALLTALGGAQRGQGGP